MELDLLKDVTLFRGMTLRQFTQSHAATRMQGATAGWLDGGTTGTMESRALGGSLGKAAGKPHRNLFAYSFTVGLLFRDRSAIRNENVFLRSIAMSEKIGLEF